MAITVALLATFMGICKVKDDNIVQGMQQAQADKLDHWNFYQARNIREDMATATATQLRLAAAGAPAALQEAYRATSRSWPLPRSLTSDGSTGSRWSRPSWAS